MKVYREAILPSAFMANGIACGLKKSGKLDLALIYSVMPAKASCKFTANKFKAAPLRLNKINLARHNDFRQSSLTAATPIVLPEKMA